MPNSSLVHQVEIMINGSPASDDVMNVVVEVEVDQHAHLPGMFMIRLYDPDLILLESGPLDLTDEVEITVDSLEDSTTVTLIKGEITSLEPAFGTGKIAELIVRGYDKSHRLYREAKNRAFLNIKDSDIANQVAGIAGLSPQVEATSTVYEHVYQDNQSDLSFLKQRAWRIGYECFVDGDELYFRKPPTSGSAATLKWGENLLEFHPRMALAEQVDEVMVKGWDVSSKQAIVGRATAGSLYPSVGESNDGQGWAATFGAGKQIIDDLPVISQAEADQLAQARLDEISGGFMEAEGYAYDSPAIRAGQAVTLEEIGTRFSGNYLVTQATHRWTLEGFFTTFYVRGTRSGTLAEQRGQQTPVRRWAGIVPAIVTNTDDPEGWGRIKVKFPWLTEDAESNWARLVSVGAGPTAGLIAIPDVGDEVAVAFEHGNFNRPYVLGGLWNGVNAIPEATSGAASGELPLVQSWQSRNGHVFTMYDNADNKIELVTIDGHTLLFDDANKKVEVQTAGGHKLIFDDQGKKVEASSSGGHKVTLDDNARKITIQSSGDVEIKAGMNMKLEATANLDIKAGGIATIKGSLVNIN